MSEIERTIRDIRPKLRHVDPKTFWSCVVFSTYYTVMGIALFNAKILLTLKFVNFLPIKLWSVIFVLFGVLMIWSLAINNWKAARAAHAFGICISVSWWLGLLLLTIDGRNPFLLYIWSVIMSLQIIVWIYFSPRIKSD